MIEQSTRTKMADRLVRMMDELSKESDRGSMIVAVAWIEDDLTRLLKSYLLPTLRAHEKEDELFGTQGYLGTFASKIDLAYRLGLIRQKVLRSLHLCRKVRNDFAHTFEKLSYEHPSVRDRVVEIFHLNEAILESMLSTIKPKLPSAVTSKLSDEITGVKALQTLLGTRALFELVASTLAGGLLLITDEMEPVQPLE